MAHEHSIYRKVQIVLETAKSSNSESLNGLEAIIKEKNLTAFHSRQFDREKDIYTTSTSIKSIRRVVRFCRELELVKENGSLTAAGREALHRARFEDVIVARVLSYFKNADIEVAQINQLIADRLHSRTPALTTANEIWETLKTKISYSKFSPMLTLLSQCGGARSSRKKVYLGIKPRP